MNLEGFLSIPCIIFRPQQTELRNILFCILLFLSPLAMKSIHIVGGEMTYEYLGGTDYLFTLKVYRDCNGVGGAEFDSSAPIGIFDGNNNLITVEFMSDLNIVLLDTDVNFGCANVNAPVCVQEGTYTSIVQLPANTTGYWVAYQRCCRNGTIVNLNAPGDMGATYAAFVPPTVTVGVNSSPAFNDFPPVGICQNIPFSFDHSASDIDGDSLAYSFCTPYTGGSTAYPAPNPPSAPIWNTILWGGGYSALNPIDAAPGFAIDPLTGEITGTPNQQGQYVVGVCVKEYRDGVEISEIRRDFQFNIVACPSLVVSAFANFSGSQTFCTGTTVEFENLSVNASVYDWTFGDGQVSSLSEPVITFNTPGTFDVTLIVDPASSCPDTTVTTYIISDAPILDIDVPVLNCPSETYDIEMTDVLGNIADYQWSTDPNVLLPANTTNVIQNLEILEPGDYTLDVILANGLGCESDASVSFNVPSHPVAQVAQLTDPCAGLSFVFDNQSQNATTYDWEFGDPNGIVVSQDFEPSHTYPSAGEFTVSLTASAPGTCENSTTMTFEANPEVVANFVSPPAQCQENNSFDYQAGGEYGLTAQFDWEFTGAQFSSALENVTNVVFDSAGIWPVTLIITEGPCSSSYTDFTETVDEIEVDFFTEGLGCQPYNAFFSNLTTGGQGNEYHWEFGDGSVSSDIGSTVHEYENPGTYTVTLTVESTVGCPGIDSETKVGVIEVLPTPQAAFSMDPPFADINEPVVELSSEAFGADSSIYLITGQTAVEGFDATVEFQSGGLFEITQVVTNEVGCESRLTKPFVITGHTFFAPNAITMNADGLNDFFKPSILGDIVEYDFSVYDRWGGLLFHTTDVNMPWVPEYAHVGMYVYDIRLRDNYDFTRQYRGSFSLIR